MDQEGSQTPEVSKPEPEAAKPEPQVSPRHRLSLSWLVWPFMGIFFYVLSVGPVAKAYHVYDWPNKHPQMSRACDVIYAPLGALSDNYAPADRLLSWYLRLWHAPVAD